MFSVQRAYSKTLICSLMGLVAVLTGAGTVLASNTGVAPVLVPYTITTIAGNSQSAVPGFGGDGVPALNATLNAPNALAVDSVGNVYIADTSNALIREVNAQTGIIRTIAGVAPTKCTGVTCTTTNPGCADGVPAVGSQVGSRINGMVVDTFGNLYFSDYNYQGVWVIYHGGAQVANFISLVDNATVPTPQNVQPGYVYHIAGNAVPKVGGGCSGTTGNRDKVLATSTGTTGIFHDPLQMGIDAAGNLYVQDFANGVVRVINTQATAQTFFGVTVQPGYVAAVVGCSASLTASCPSATQFGVPANQALYATALSGMTTDQYGNVYELDSKGATNIYAGVAYAGGGPLAHLINLESGLTATPGDWYTVINSITSPYGLPSAVQAIAANGSNSIVLRPTSITVDPLGNLYYMDLHWLSIYRIDVNSQLATRINGLTGIVAGTAAAPVTCSGPSGQFSTDNYGDGCPVQNAKFNSGGTGYMTFDGVGNLYVSDIGNNIVRKVSVGTQFPATATGTNLTQTLQVHFDAGNLPASTGINSGFTMTSGTSDFTIAGTSCSNYTVGIDASLECYVKVAFAPSAPGVRKGTLQASTANGSTYNFALSGFGNGPQLVVDGGAPSTVPVTGLGGPSALATDAAGNVYIADSVNNRVVMSPAGGGVQTTIGSGLKNPLGVAVDPAGNVFIADAGNNRIVEVAAGTGAQSVLTTNVVNPHGIALDSLNNLYVADTGNARVLEVSPFGEFPAAALLAYTGAQTFTSPVAVAVDKIGNVYVADSGNSTGLIEILAGGGDFQPVLGGTTLAAPSTIINFGTAFVSKPGGVAVDGAGNVYVSDSTGNTVQMIPSSSGAGSDPFTLNFEGLKGPAGIALDPTGNLYVADTGNNRVLLDNRTSVAVNFGTQPQFQPAATIPLTVTNIGTSSLSPTSPFAQLSGATANFAETNTCAASSFSTGVLGSGLHCSETLSFRPIVNGPLSASASVQGGAVNLNITGTGENPVAKLSLAITSPASGGPISGAPANIMLTATQPNGGNTPTGTVTFNYTVNGVAQTPITQTLTAGTGGSSSTVVTLNNLLFARSYVINATYNGDASDSVTKATPLLFTVPGLPLSVVASPVSFTYGSAVPTITGTVTGILPADQSSITVSFTSAATASTPVGTYPIRAVLSGGNSQNYTIPNAVTSTGTAALVTENKAPLTLITPNFTSAYGQYPGLTYNNGQTLTGLVNSDKSLLKYTFTNPNSTVLPVGSYTITPTLRMPTCAAGCYDNINNYNVTITSGTLTVVKEVSALAVTQASTAVLPTAASSGRITISAAPNNFGYFGTPTGTVTLQDTFTPLSATGAGTPVTEPPLTLTLAKGTASYTPTDPTIGIHSYVFTYSGDSNFLATDTSISPSSLIVDNADFTVVSTSSPIQIAPGILPGGVSTVVGEQAATPEIATVYITPILGSTQVVTLTCAVPASYLTCALIPNVITLSGRTVMTSVLSVQAPATLPINYTGQVRQPGPAVVYAFLPLALLSLLPFCSAGRRIRASRLLVLLLSVALLAGAMGCGGNLVKFYTPVPAGPSQVVITGTSGSVSRSFTVPLNVQ